MNLPYTDKWIYCATCGKEFLWDAGEQAWYQLTNLRNAPRHCKTCREERKKQANRRMNETRVTMDQ